jgi:hypothetical protein
MARARTVSIGPDVITGTIVTNNEKKYSRLSLPSLFKHQLRRARNRVLCFVVVKQLFLRRTSKLLLLYQ